MRLAGKDEYCDIDCPNCYARLIMNNDDIKDKNPDEKFLIQCINCRYELKVRLTNPG